MGVKKFNYARRIDADTIGLYKDDMTKLLSLDDTINKYTTFKGGTAANDGLLFHPNATITSGKIQLAGSGEVILSARTDKNLELLTDGTGIIKMGNYTAGAATDSTGYVSIIDLSNTPRKLMVQA